MRTSLKSFLQNSSRYGSISSAYTCSGGAQYVYLMHGKGAKGKQLVHNMPTAAHDDPLLCIAASLPLRK